MSGSDIHPHGSFVFEWCLIALASVALAAYLHGARRQWRLGKPWSHWRSVSFAAGVLLVVVALHPFTASFAHGDLRGHMLQHLLLGMFAPLGLILAAPISLMLRNLPLDIARRLAKVLQSRFISGLSRPTVALLLNLGGMYLLYLTPLYALSLHNGLIHGWLHLHFLLAGCLFTWAIAGPDPGPHRPSANGRLLVMFVAIAGHTLLSKIMYAYGWPRGTSHSPAELEAAAKLMYYGGDLAELLLLTALCMSNRKRKDSVDDGVFFHLSAGR